MHTSRVKQRGRRSISGKRFIENLESRLLMAANPVISEFMAKNSSTLADGNGNFSDWIEITNQGDASINLQGWHLTDDLTKPGAWTFPSYNLTAGREHGRLCGRLWRGGCGEQSSY